MYIIPKLKTTTDILVAAIGFNGEIHADDSRVHDVLDTLNRIDPK